MGINFGSKLNSPHVMDDAHLQNLKKTEAIYRRINFFSA
jgi:hypothetical protein